MKLVKSANLQTDKAVEHYMYYKQLETIPKHIILFHIYCNFFPQEEKQENDMKILPLKQQKHSIWPTRKVNSTFKTIRDAIMEISKHYISTSN